MRKASEIAASIAECGGVKSEARKSRHTLQRLAREEEGTVAIIFSLSILLLLAAVGGAVDYGRAVTAREQIQGSVDAAVLAAARIWQLEQDATAAHDKGIEFFNRNKPAGVSTATPVVTVDAQRGAMSMDVAVSLQTPFLSLVLKDGFSFTAHAEALLPIGQNAQTNLEISLMLDTTGSMGGQKIIDLKAAAKDLVDIVVWDDQSKYTSKVALSPFAPRVKVGAYASDLTGQAATSGTKKLLDCVTERTGAAQFTDDAPAAGKYLGKYAPTGNAASQYSATGVCSDTTEIMPLSNDKTALKARISTFTAGGSTAGSLGTAWAWYMLSPKWANVWPVASRPVAYNTPDTEKIAVLMTDGEYNLFQASGSVVSTVSGYAKTLCTNMKAQGITVYTVGFQLGGNADAIATLKACATDASKFYNAEDGEALKMAFRAIALQISRLRLSQ